MTRHYEACSLVPCSQHCYPGIRKRCRIGFANLDQLAPKEEQMAQAIAALQAAEQDIGQKISAPPPPKAVHVPPPKPPQPAVQ